MLFILFLAMFVLSLRGHGPSAILALHSARGLCFSEPHGHGPCTVLNLHGR